MNESLIKNRALIEINLDNLEYNVNVLKRKLKGKTKIMAVVKANVYGHGMIEVSKKLESIGIEDFAYIVINF